MILFWPKNVKRITHQRELEFVYENYQMHYFFHCWNIPSWRRTRREREQFWKVAKLSNLLTMFRGSRRFPTGKQGISRLISIVFRACSPAVVTCIIVLAFALVCFTLFILRGTRRSHKASLSITVGNLSNRFYRAISIVRAIICMMRYLDDQLNALSTPMPG